MTVPSGRCVSPSFPMGLASRSSRAVFLSFVISLSAGANACLTLFSSCISSGRKKVIHSLELSFAGYGLRYSVPHYCFNIVIAIPEFSSLIFVLWPHRNQHHVQRSAMSCFHFEQVCSKWKIYVLLCKPRTQKPKFLPFKTFSGFTFLYVFPETKTQPKLRISWSTHL